MLGIVKIENEFGKHKYLIRYKMFNGKMGVNNQEILNANNNLTTTLPKAQDLRLHCHCCSQQVAPHCV